jgi:hypothetical protein
LDSILGFPQSFQANAGISNSIRPGVNPRLGLVTKLFSPSLWGVHFGDRTDLSFVKCPLWRQDWSVLRQFSSLATISLYPSSILLSGDRMGQSFANCPLWRQDGSVLRQVSSLATRSFYPSSILLSGDRMSLSFVKSNLKTPSTTLYISCSQFYIYMKTNTHIYIYIQVY